MDSVRSTSMERDDEIDLFDLLDDLKEKWYWLAGTIALTLLAAIAYAWSATAIYQTEIVVKSVSEVELLELNQAALADVLDEDFITTEKAFRDVRALFLSGAMMGEFYAELRNEANPALTALLYQEALSPEQNLQAFIARFSHKDAGKEDDLSLHLTFELPDPKLASDVLNRFKKFVLTRYENRTKANVALRTEAVLEQWQLKAGAMRDTYQANKQRRILSLTEAAQIAASINQAKPLYSGDRVAVGSQPPLFMMGEKTLRAELALLKKRTQADEDAYIAGLPELLKKMAVVEQADIDWNKVNFVEIDREAVVPLAPVKPRKKLIVALGAVAGFTAGSMFALLAAANSRRRERKRLKKRMQTSNSLSQC